VCRFLPFPIPAILPPRHSPHPIPIIPIWRGFELFFFIPSNARDPYNLEECLRKTTATICFPITVNPYDQCQRYGFYLSRSRRCRAMSAIPAILPPRHSPHPIPVIPIWRGFELFFFIPSNARDPFNLEECLRKTTAKICFPIPGDVARCRRSRRSLSPAIHRT
jgi:hypothetical protein